MYVIHDSWSFPSFVDLVLTTEVPFSVRSLLILSKDRRRILDLQPVYKQLTREEKTPFSESVVSWVKDRGGRFLKEDKEQEFFYQVTDKAAREKVSQALREDHTLAGRLAKKAKLASPKSRKPSENSKKAKKGARKQSKHSLQH
mmetsp:Transcript_28086/g.46502  ORF Transcript_28086/g.46502 Transcript_28086/m.46502 type:complete len:144 (-) Transcript_28086:219-650(-)